MCIDLALPVSGALKPPDRAPSPTCHFIKNRQCQRTIQHQRRTTNRSPIYTGGPVVRSVLATVANRASRNRQGRVGEGPYMEGVDSGQPPFCNFISKAPERLRSPWFYVG